MPSSWKRSPYSCPFKAGNADTDYLIFFDTDCVPTHREWLPALLEDFREPRTIADAAQTANHLRAATFPLSYFHRLPESAELPGYEHDR